MALSNIFNEPRREITESAVGGVVGVVIVAVALAADYQIGLWLQSMMTTEYSVPPLVATMVIGICILFVGGGLFFIFVTATHALGDAICNALQRRGVHLRPRERR